MHAQRDPINMGHPIDVGHPLIDVADMIQKRYQRHAGKPEREATPEHPVDTLALLISSPTFH